MSSEPNDEYIFIRYDEVPMYLHSSAFYKSLSAEGDHSVPIEIPCNSFKADDTVNDLEDFKLLLHTMIFWGLDVIPETIFDFCHDRHKNLWQSVTVDLPDNGNFHNILTTCFDRTESVLPAVDSGHPEIVQHWMKTHPPENLPDPAHPCIEAASIGSLPLLKELREHDYPWNGRTCAAAARGGHLECLMYLHEQGCPWAESACTAAARNGHLDCLKYLHECGCPWLEDGIGYDAAEAGHLTCLEFAHEHGGILNEDITRTRHIDCLRYALERNCPVHERILSLPSIRNLSLEIVKLFTEHGVVWTEVAVEASVECTVAHTKYLIQQGCQYKENITYIAVYYEAPDHLAYLIDEALLEMTPKLYSEAVAWGRLDCVKVLVDRGCPCDFEWDRDNVFGEWYDDQLILSCIQYTTERGWPCNEDLIGFVCNNDLPLCWKYLGDEGIVDSTFASPSEYYEYMCKLKAVEN